MLTLLLQTEEIKAVESLVTQITDTGYIGITVLALCILLVGGIIAYFQQRNFNRQSEANQKANQAVVEAFTTVVKEYSDRLEEAQDTKAALGIVADNQTAILSKQDEQGKLLMSLPELIGLVNEALSMLSQTVAQAKEIALATNEQTAAGFGKVSERFDTVDMKNGEILAELKAIHELLQAQADRQELGDLSQTKAQRKQNEDILATLKQIQEAIERTTQETPVIELKHQKPSESEE
jgi:Mg2+ and Co2+ transporter CorA